MFIELAEALDCPSCGEGCGLVAFVRESDRRRVLEGRLGCPLCEIEFPIVGGAIDFRPRPPAGAGDERPEAAGSAPASDAPPLDPELTVRLAALLGVRERAGSSILLGIGLAPYAAEVARLAERVEVLAVIDPDEGFAALRLDIDQLAAGVDPLLGLGPGRWPIRSGVLDAIAFLGTPGEALDEAWRCLRSKGRLVLVEAGGIDPRPLLERGFDPLAEDDETWVGQRA